MANADVALLPSLTCGTGVGAGRGRRNRDRELVIDPLRQDQVLLAARIHQGGKPPEAAGVLWACRVFIAFLTPRRCTRANMRHIATCSRRVLRLTPLLRRRHHKMLRQTARQHYLGSAILRKVFDPTKNFHGSSLTSWWPRVLTAGRILSRLHNYC